jgi:hypothetical protein
MKRAIFAVLATMLPLTAAAQDPPSVQPTGTDTSATAAITASSSETAVDPTVDAAQYGAARRGGQRRSSSAVSYIEDATVGSQFRVRFDSGWDVTSPDLSEFFYAKCGCYRTLPPTSAALDPAAPGPGPGIVQSLNYQQLTVVSEHSTGKHASAFIELPFRWIKPTDFVAGSGSFGNQSGLGDIRFGSKLALVSSSTHDITLMVRLSVPTGDASKGLGIDHGSFEPALIVRQALGSRMQLEGMFGDFHPTGSSKGPVAGSGNFAGDVMYYGIGPSFAVISRRSVRITPVAELTGWHILSGYQTSSLITIGPIGGTSDIAAADASGSNIVNLNVGGRISMSSAGSFYVGYGWALTNQEWYDHVLRIEYRTKF